MDYIFRGFFKIVIYFALTRKAEKKEGLFPSLHLEFRVKNIMQGVLSIHDCSNKRKLASEYA